MVDVTPLVKEGAQIIQSYAGGRFRISGEVYEGAVMVAPQSTRMWDFSGEVADLAVDDFSMLFEEAGEVDVLLLGCGETIAFLKPELRAALKERGLSVDVMDTGAACRTYNVLITEGRRVVAALLPF